MSSHVRVLALLTSMLLCCGGLAVLCGLVGRHHGMHTVAFMAAEVRKFQFLHQQFYISWEKSTKNIIFAFYFFLVFACYGAHWTCYNEVSISPGFRSQYKHAIFAVICRLWNWSCLALSGFCTCREIQHWGLATAFCRYSIHLWDLNHEGTWESKGTYVYYTDFIMELTLLCLDLMHHIHMLVSFPQSYNCKKKKKS